MLILRLTTVADLDFVLTAEKAPENRPFVGQWTYDQHVTSLADPDIRHFILEASTSKQMVGYTILAGLTNPHQRVEVRRLVITEKGKGYGRAALQQIKHAAFGQWNVHRLWLEVFEMNTRARTLYISEGFTVEGLQRDLIKLNDSFLSVHLMSLLQPEYMASGSTAS
jgi:diamine N-acetyltransferase